MANTRSAAKQARVSERKRHFNRMVLSQLNTEEKRMRLLAKEGDLTKLTAQLKQVYSLADRAAKNNVISRNAASRKKSRLAALLPKKK